MAEREFQARIRSLTQLIARLFEASDRSPEELDAGFALLEDVYDRLSDGPARDSLLNLLDRAVESEGGAVKLADRLMALEPHAETLRQNPEALAGILHLNETNFTLAASNPAEFSRTLQQTLAQPARFIPPAPPTPAPDPSSRRRNVSALWTDRNGPLTLGLGNTGPEVAAVQCFLYHDGFGFLSLDDIDGFFDTDMEAAVIEFQEANDLEPDGIVGSETQQALRQNVLEDGDRPTLSRGSTDPAVVSLQTALLQAGYLEEMGDIDGQFGPRTEAAAIAFQQDNNLTADGIVGPNTWQALAAAVQEQPQASSSNLSQRETATPTLQEPAQEPASGAETAFELGQQVVNLAETAGTPANQLWTALAGAVNNAIEQSGEPELSFTLPSGTPVTIAGDLETNTISVAGGQGELIASQQVQDGQLSSDIRDPGLAGEVRDRLESAQKEAEQSDREPEVAVL